MTGNYNLVTHFGALLLLTIFHNPVIVATDRGEGMPAVGLFTFGDSYFDAGNKLFLSQNQNPPQSKWPYGKSRDDPNDKFSDGHVRIRITRSEPDTNNCPALFQSINPCHRKKTEQSEAIASFTLS